MFSSAAQSCLTLCDPIDFNTPGFPVHHQLPEFTQTHVQCIQPSHLLSSPSPPTFNLSQGDGGQQSGNGGQLCGWLATNLLEQTIVCTEIQT